VICVSLCVTVDEAGRIYSAGKRDDSVARAVHACANVLVAREQVANSPFRGQRPDRYTVVEAILLHGEECAQYAYVDVVSSGKRARRADGLAGAVVAALNYAYLYFVGVVRRTSLIRLTKDVIGWELGILDASPLGSTLLASFWLTMMSSVTLLCEVL
jgi:ribosomal protein S9